MSRHMHKKIKVVALKTFKLINSWVKQIKLTRYNILF